MRAALLLTGLALPALVGLGGCTDYLARRDTLLLESGEAVQANIAVQTIDPWPAHARTVNRDVDGERLRGAIERYRNPQAGGGGFGGPPGLVPIGAGPPPAAPIAR